MAAVSGQGNTYNLPNYHGALFQVSPSETPFLSAIGGIGGAKVTHALDFEWQTRALRGSSANNAAVEGAAAPTSSENARSNVKNTVEIHQSAIEVTYSKLGASGQYSGANVAPQFDDIVIDELSLQTNDELASMAVDIEQSFLNGTYSRPGTNATARKTQGVLGAIATNVSANGGTARAITTGILETHLQTMFQNGSPLNQETTVIMAGPAQALKLSQAYNLNSQLSAPTRDRNVGGYALKTVVTLFGTFGLMVNRWMPAGEIAVVDLAACYPVFLEIPGKGLLFVEELARTGSSRKFQLYGEIGLEYGPEVYHGIVKDLS
jgi:uncharacterized protein DUF5309